MAFDQDYFSTHTYANISFGRYSQYWWSNCFYARLARRLGRKGSRLLEIGSGLGHLVGQLENDFETFGLDVNPWALMQARQVAGRSHFQCGSAEQLPFEDHSFGVIILKHVVEHLPHPERCVQELDRVLSGDGVVILATPNMDSKWRLIKGEKWIGYQDPTHISLKPPEEWQGLLKEAHFNHIKIFADGFWDVPYIKGIPNPIQKMLFGLPGGLQAMSGILFLPRLAGESIIVIARRTKLPSR